MCGKFLNDQYLKKIFIYFYIGLLKKEHVTIVHVHVQHYNKNYANDDSNEQEAKLSLG